MPKQFLLPDLGEGLTEAEVTSWLVSPGDMVAIDQPVVEVESAKSIVELPCPFAGIVGELQAQVGETVSAGQPLLSIITNEDAAPDPAEAPAAESASGSSGAVLIGYGLIESAPRTGRRPQGRFGRRPAAQAEASPAAASATTASTTTASTTAAASARDTALIDPSRHSRVVSPMLRHMAHEAGFDASDLLGSGPQGLVVRSDVEAAIAALAGTTAAPASAPAAAAAAAAPASDPARAAEQGPRPGSDEDVIVPLKGIRDVIATRLTRAHQTIPAATVWLEADATPLVEAKDRLQAVTGERYSITVLIARFVIASLKKFPALNSSIDEDAHAIVQHAAINLGIAAQTPRGLMVPVLHGAHRFDTAQLRDRLGELVEQAKVGDFAPQQLSGSTFTLDNYGGFGIDGGVPIINPPESGILGVGRMVERPWVVDGRIEPRKVLTLTLVFDHRVCDGDVASGFLTSVARCIEEPLLGL